MTSQSGAKRRIVVGVDGSESSFKALEWASRQAELAGSVVHAVAVWHWPANYGLAVPDPADLDLADAARSTLESALDVARKAHPDVEYQTSVVQGYAAQVLVEESKGAELVVVGSRGHGELVGMLIGSVSEYCVTHAHCPVVVLRH